MSNYPAQPQPDPPVNDDQVWKAMPLAISNRPTGPKPSMAIGKIVKARTRCPAVSPQDVKNSYSLELLLDRMIRHRNRTSWPSPVIEVVVELSGQEVEDQRIA